MKTTKCKIMNPELRKRIRLPKWFYNEHYCLITFPRNASPLLLLTVKKYNPELSVLISMVEISFCTLCNCPMQL